LRVNTLVSNWATGESSIIRSFSTRRAGRNLRTAFRLGCNILILDADAREWETLELVPSEQRVIDVWWRPGNTGELMLLLAYLVRRADEWRNASIRVLAEPRAGEDAGQSVKRLQEMLEEFRIDAEIVICRMLPDDIRRQSHASALVFLPFSIHRGNFCGPDGNDLQPLLNDLGIVVMTLASQDVDLDADPDEVGESSKNGTQENTGAAPPSALLKEPADEGS
jgi:hypothetical protein